MKKSTSSSLICKELSVDDWLWSTGSKENEGAVIMISLSVDDSMSTWWDCCAPWNMFLTMFRKDQLEVFCPSLADSGSTASRGLSKERNWFEALGCSGVEFPTKASFLNLRFLLKKFLLRWNEFSLDTLHTKSKRGLFGHHLVSAFPETFKRAFDI